MLKYIRNMTKLLFLFDDCEKFALRIGEQGFIKECEKRGACPSRIIALNRLTDEPLPYSIILFERASYLYTVKPTDDLKALEMRFNISADEILCHNQIAYIYPYQVIEIPKASND